jgi:N4 Gp49/Sf6 Gp66 family protein
MKTRRRCVVVQTKYGPVRVQGVGEITTRDIEAIEAVADALQANKRRSTTMNDQQVESEIQAKGLTAPRISPAQIEASIIGEYYPTRLHSAEHPSIACLTICVLVLKNGFTVTGESACASPENFDAELGRKIARANAVAKIWPLEGYLLKQRLHDQQEFNTAIGIAGAIA